VYPRQQCAAPPWIWAPGFVLTFGPVLRGVLSSLLLPGPLGSSFCSVCGAASLDGGWPRPLDGAVLAGARSGRGAESDDTAMPQCCVLALP
jgi:hypothetical protein